MADDRGMERAYADDPFRLDGPDPRSGQSGESDESGRDADVSGWFDRTPSGWRSRVVTDNVRPTRPPHEQVIQGGQGIYHQGFNGTQFVGFLKSEMKMARNGDCIITVTVPFEYKHLAFPLSDAFGLPLSFDVQLWEPYREAAEG